MRYCTGCGKPLQDDQMFCTGCGKPVGQTPAPEPVSAPAPKKRSRAPLIIAISVLVLALAAAAVWFFLLRDSDRDDDADDEKTEQNDKQDDDDRAEGSGAPADEVTFDVHHENDTEYAVITGYDGDGEALWTVETPKYGVSQLSRVQAVDIRNDMYYYIDDGDVVALSLKNGEEVWRNDEFDGSLGDFVFGDYGKLYLCGYLGPDLFVVDTDGDTVRRIAALHDDYIWPYDIDFYDDGALAITYEQVGAGGDEGTITLDPDTFEILAVTGEGSTTPTTAGAPTSVTLSASSTLQEAGYDHSPACAMDGKNDTAWVEGASGSGVGESLSLDFGEVCTVNTLQIWAGYQKSASLYEKNSRPERVRLTFSDGSSREIVLSDTNGMQSIDLGGVNTASITITILSVYPGSAYSDTAITEIRLY